jgi:hypothetical protein
VRIGNGEPRRSARGKQCCSGYKSGSAVSGLVAAALWYMSAAGKAPKMTYAEMDDIPGFLDQVGRFNKWAAGFTGASILLSSIAMLVSARQHRLTASNRRRLAPPPKPLRLATGKSNGGRCLERDT